MLEMQAEAQLEILKRNTAEIINEDELLMKLRRAVNTGTGLRCKLGFDPSAPDLHLGHAVVLHKIKEFQELGHRVVIILGDFTGRIGDPTGRSEARLQLSEEEVNENARTYREQLFKILDPDRTEIVFNSKWLAELKFTQVLELAARYTVARMLEREDFARRYREHLPIGIHEFFYPLMQGYDSVAVRADVEFGATEQKFNILMGRYLQRDYGQEPQVALIMPILTGIDGQQKMSKSLGNYIGINEPPGEIYGKVMSISDDLMEEYFKLATRMPDGEINRLLADLQSGAAHPRDTKMRLAAEIVSLYHGPAAARSAGQEFRRVFQQKTLPDNIPAHPFNTAEHGEELAAGRLLSLLELVPSNSEARRLIDQGGVKIDEQRVVSYDQKIRVRDGMIIRIGKRRFARIVL